MHLHLTLRSAKRDTSWWRGSRCYGYLSTYPAITSTGRCLRVRIRPETREWYQIRLPDPCWYKLCIRNLCLFRSKSGVAWCSFLFGLNYLRRAPRAPRFVESLAGNMIFKANIHGFLDHFWINILFWSFLNWSNMLILTSNFGLNHPTCWNRVWTAWNQLQFTSRALCNFLCNRRLKIDWKSFCVIFHG